MQVKALFMSSKVYYSLGIVIFIVFTITHIILTINNPLSALLFLLTGPVSFFLIFLAIRYAYHKGELETTARTKQILSDVLSHDVSNIVQGLSGSLELLNSNLISLDSLELYLLTNAIVQAESLKETVRNINKLL
ncbi:MAG: hypothetical protein ACFFBD_26040, partial [Candidatus Hodarchaeota archaeon]